MDAHLLHSPAEDSNPSTGCLPSVKLSNIKRLLKGPRSRNPIQHEDVDNIEALLGKPVLQDAKQRTSSSEQLSRGVSLPDLSGCTRQLRETDVIVSDAVRVQRPTEHCHGYEEGIRVSTDRHVENRNLRPTEHYPDPPRECGKPGENSYVRVIKAQFVPSPAPGLAPNGFREVSSFARPLPQSPYMLDRRRLPVGRLLSESDTYDSGYSTPGVQYDTLPSVSSEGLYEELPQSAGQYITQEQSLPTDLPGEVLQGPTQTLVTERLLSQISEDVASGDQWKKIGRRMFKNSVVENIDADHKGSAEKACQLLMKWKQTRGNNATVQRLADIFRELECIELAEKLERLSKKVWRQSLEILEEQGQQPELVHQLQNRISSLQECVNQRHEQSNKEKEELQRKYQELEIKHKATELELMELHKQLQRYENQDYRLSSKWVETLLQRMQNVESVLKNEKVDKKKERHTSDKEDLESQPQCMSGLVSKLRRSLPSNSSCKDKLPYSPIKQQESERRSRTLRQSFIYAIDDEVPDEQSVASTPAHKPVLPVDRQPPPYPPCPEYGHIGEPVYQQTQQRASVPPRHMQYPDSSDRHLGSRPDFSDRHAGSRLSPTFISWLNGKDEEKEAVIV